MTFRFTLYALFIDGMGYDLHDLHALRLCERELE